MMQNKLVQTSSWFRFQLLVVVSVLARKGRCERASIDEVYLDLTDAAEAMLSESPSEVLEEMDEEVLKSHVQGLNVDSYGKENTAKDWFCRSGADHHKLLACGAIIVARLRMDVLKETQFTFSAGIAHNKMLAKLASAMHKPAQQTVMPSSSVKNLLVSLPIKKMKQLGGKLGSTLQSDLGVNTVGDLLQFSEGKLQEHYGINTASWLWNIARGISGDQVEGRLLPKSHDCGKTFPGPKALKSIASVQKWLNVLAEELNEWIQSDLYQNNQVAHTLTLHARAYKLNDSESDENFPSKSSPLRVETHGNQMRTWGIMSLSLSASKILATPTESIEFFLGGEPSSTSGNESFSEMNEVDP